MANGDNLPYQDLDVIPFTAIISEWGDGIGDDILALAAGTGLDDGAVTADKLATGAIYLGHSRATSSTTVGGTSIVDITGASVNVTIPDTSRQVKITAKCGSILNHGSGNLITVHIREGSTSLETSRVLYVANGIGVQDVMWVGTPSPGSHTYKVSAINSVSGNTSVQSAAAGSFSTQILVELL